MIDGYLLGEEVESEEEVTGNEHERHVLPLVVEVAASAERAEGSSVKEPGIEHTYDYPSTTPPSRLVCIDMLFVPDSPFFPLFSLTVGNKYYAMVYNT